MTTKAEQHLRSPETMTSETLIRYAADALTVARAQRRGAAAGTDAYATIGALRQVITALDNAMGSVATALTQRPRADQAIVEGPFTGDIEAATGTAEQWLSRARLTLMVGPARSIDNAHVALAGLAHASPVTTF
ncbi:hypothetical protein [Fodinicola feengrottensis]|uniref:hypothetical protein n=1 Tax=Fodinicola feengrottensis TaxID=435914 RepID=UPI0013D3FBF8|nr:hypothetical protein [Fodinicola feengrottensis]